MAVDWEAMKIEYITTNTSQHKLAKKYGVNRSVIAVKSQNEKWVDARNQYRADAIQKALNKSAEQDVKRLSKLMDATGKLIDVAMRAIEDDKQFNRFIVSEGLGEGVSETTEKQFEKVDTKALKDTVAVLKDLTAMVRDFYDIPTAAQREQREQARERIEMEKRKTMLMTGDSDGDDTGVVMIPEVSEGA